MIKMVRATSLYKNLFTGAIIIAPFVFNGEDMLMNAVQSQAPIFSISVEYARDFACKNLRIDDAPLSLAHTRDKLVMGRLTEQASSCLPI